MKKNNKKVNTKSVIANKKVMMEKKKDVILIKNDIDRMSEKDIRDLIELIEKENQQMRDIYYAFNTPIMNVRQRRFVDLVKEFFCRVRKNTNGIATIGVRRRGITCQTPGTKL